MTQTTIPNPLSGINELPVRWDERNNLFIGSFLICTYWMDGLGLYTVSYDRYYIKDFTDEVYARAKCMEIATEFLNKLKS